MGEEFPYGKFPKVPESVVARLSGQLPGKLFLPADFKERLKGIEALGATSRLVAEQLSAAVPPASQIDSSLREVNERTAKRRRAIDDATIATASTLAALLENVAADRRESRTEQRRMFRLMIATVSLAAASLIVGIWH